MCVYGRNEQLIDQIMSEKPIDDRSRRCFLGVRTLSLVMRSYLLGLIAKIMCDAIMTGLEWWVVCRFTSTN